MPFQIDLRVPPCAPVSEVAGFVELCEEAGFDGVGILDSQMLERDVFVSMAAAAMATSRIRIASAVLNPITRHLSVIASAAKTVAELAPGRAEFWIGRGFSSVQTIGTPPATVRQMRQCVLTLKSILSGEDVSFGDAQQPDAARRLPNPQDHHRGPRAAHHRGCRRGCGRRVAPGGHRPRRGGPGPVASGDRGQTGRTQPGRA